MIELSDNVVNEYLDRAIAEKGADYVYPGSADGGQCRYFEHDKSPGCVVGHIMYYAGITADDVIKHDNKASLKGSYELIENNDAVAALERIGISVSSRSSRLLLNAQESQDGGYTWGQAVADAREGYCSSETGGC